MRQQIEIIYSANIEEFGVGFRRSPDNKVDVDRVDAGHKLEQLAGQMGCGVPLPDVRGLRTDIPLHCDYRCGAAARASGQECSSFVSYHSGRERIAGSSLLAGSRLIRSIARWYFSMR